MSRRRVRIGRWAALLGLALALALPLMATAQGYLFAPDGTATRPGRSYTLDTRLGSYRIGRDNEGFVADGQVRWHYGAAAPSLAVVFHVLSGVESRFGGPLYVQSALGVGTDTPGAALHVVGAMQATALTLQTQLVIQALHVQGAISAVSATLQNQLTTNGVIFGTDNAFNLGTSVSAGRPRDLFVARDAHVAGYLHVQGAFTTGAHVVTVASDGVGGQANAETLSGLRSLYLLECLDGDGCTVTLGSSATVGTVIRLINVSTSGSANHNLTLSDAAPLHLAGALTLSADDAVTFVYVVNRSGAGNWVELSRSAN